MKTLALTLLLIFAAFVTAQSADITTRDGTTYKDAIVVSVANHQVLVWHASGQTAIPCANLPDDIRKQYCDLALFVLPSPLPLTDGTSLESPEVTSLDQEAISIRHSSGSGRYAYAALPAAVRSRYPFTESSRVAYRARYAQRASRSGAASTQPSSGSSTSYPGPIFTGGSVHVDGYYRKDGTWVPAHTRTAPDGITSNNESTPGSSLPSTAYTRPTTPYSGGGTVTVRGYTRKDGTRVSGYTRRK